MSCEVGIDSCPDREEERCISKLQEIEKTTIIVTYERKKGRYRYREGREKD